MIFEKTLPEWNATGTEPPQTLKDEGWQPQQKPPADYFNWFQNRVYEALKEIQEKAATKDEITVVDLTPLEAAINEIRETVTSHQAETASKFTNLNLNVIDMAVELETLKGATLNGVTANIFIETFQTLDDINLMNGVYDSVNKRLVV